MSDDDNDRGTLSNHSDSFLIPVTTDGTKLLWDGNAATILGLLYEVKRFFTRSGLFQMLISARAVSLSNGKLAIEDANSVYFVNGTLPPPAGTFELPCPPSATRLASANSGRSSVTQIASISGLTGSDKDNFIIANHLVKKEDSRLLRSLTFVFQ